MHIPELVKKCVRSVAGPAIDQARSSVYAVRFHHAYDRFKKESFASRLRLKGGVGAEESQERLWEKLRTSSPGGVGFETLALGQDLKGLGGQEYFTRHKELYLPIGNGRQKALEHSLTFELFDFSRVRRYCDIASSFSPISEVFARDFPQVEYWKQDLIFRTDLEKREIGGSAQKMSGVTDGFFDAMALHCSYEHFNGVADGDFLKEVDRVLSPDGACLIIPLYVDRVPRIFFDPTRVSKQELIEYDAEAELCATYDYRQSHGRYYSPKTLTDRVLSRLPSGMKATLIQLKDQKLVGEDIYLRFGLILHRAGSVFRSRG